MSTFTQLRLAQVALVMLLTSLSSIAVADFDMKAGPIWDNDDAKAKCAAACTLEWNGNWVTKIAGKMSICSGTNRALDGKSYITGDATGGIEAGPIWNNADAKAKCTTTLRNIKWNGQWTTTTEGEMSVCGCKGGKLSPWRPNVIDR